MRRAKMFLTAFLIGVLCWTPVMQPFAAYAQIALADSSATGSNDDSADSQQGGEVLPDAGDSEGEGEQGLAPEPESGAAGQPDVEGVDAAPDDALQSAQEDAETPEADIVVDEVAVDNTASGFLENSWRYENGVLRSDLESSDRSLYSRDARPEGATAWGIDVSNHQGSIDWAKVKAAGVDYAILRCGYGEGIMDDNFIRNVQGCKKYGIPFGVYLYCYAWDAKSAREEAEGTLSILSRAGVKPSDLAFPVYYDIENTVGNKNHPDYGKPAGVDGNNQYHVIRNNATFTAMAETYCNIIKNAGFEPGVYASLNWWRNYLNDAKFNSWDRWVAQYYSECTYEGTYSMWQYSSSGRVDGIRGNVDVNWYFEGSAAGWREIEGERYYFGVDGSPVLGQLYYRGHWYWLDPERGGAMATGFVDVPSASSPSGTKRCYYGADGAMRYGEQRVDGRWYHFNESNGSMSRGLTRLPSGKTVLYGEDGAMLYGRQDVPGRGTCFFNLVNGGMVSRGWVSDSGLRYYVGSKGALVEGELYDRGHWYWLDPERGGAMATGFVDVPSASSPSGTKRCYYGADGAMRYGEQRVDGRWYHFNESNGSMSRGLTRLPSGKTVLYGEDGAMLYGRQDVPGRGTCFFNPVNGGMAIDEWISVSESLEEYYSESGVFAASRRRFDDGSIKLYEASGKMLLGWQRLGVHIFYADPVTGTLYTGEHDIEGKKYYFSDKGEMIRGFILLDDSSAPGGKIWVWHDANGVRQYGEKYINGAWYYLNDDTGAVTYGWKYLPKDRKWVWYGPYMGNGKMRYGTHEVDGFLRYFDPISGACDKINYQNPKQFYQVSTRTVKLPSYAQGGKFSYVTPSRIKVDSSRQDCINTFVARAFDYLGTPYVWDYACAPGIGIDCAGLVMQSLYATGVNLSPMNPWDHFFTPGHDQYANYMWEHGKFKKLSFSQRQVGDLVCYPGHIAIYIGGDRIIEAYPRHGVRVSSVYSSSNIRGVLRPFV